MTEAGATQGQRVRTAASPRRIASPFRRTLEPLPRPVPRRLPALDYLDAQCSARTALLKVPRPTMHTAWRSHLTRYYYFINALFYERVIYVLTLCDHLALEWPLVWWCPSPTSTRHTGCVLTAAALQLRLSCTVLDAFGAGGDCSISGRERLKSLANLV